MSAPPEVEAFVRRYFERRGGSLEGEEPGILRARLPEALRPAFEGVDSVRVTFDPAIASAQAAVDLACVGSYLMDRIVEDATRSGWHTVARVEAGDEPATEVVARTLHPRNAAMSVEGSTNDPVPHLLFVFRVRLTTDERVERIEPVLVDARTGRERLAAPPVFEDRLALPEDVGFDWARVADAYEAACRILEARIAPQVEAFRAQADALRRAEVERVQGYFERSVREALDSRAAGGADEARALGLERGRRLAEAEEKYRFSGEVELCNVRTILLDVTSASVALSHRGARRAFPVEYDALTREVPPPACEVCGLATREPVLCFGGHLAGPECVRACSFCDRVHCRDCVSKDGAIAPCAACRRAMCPDHAEVCALSQRPFCPDDVHACAICGRTVGPSYVARCENCEQRYCVVCVAPPQERCATCRSLAPAPAADPAVAALRRADPALAKVPRWRRGSNTRYTVLAAKGLVWSQVFVLDAKGAVLVRKKVLGA